jgi:hypothetical protein
MVVVVEMASAYSWICAQVELTVLDPRPPRTAPARVEIGLCSPATFYVIPTLD